MIQDRIENISRYGSLHRKLAAALQFLTEADLKVLPIGKTVIDPDDHVLTSHECGHPRSGSRLETHRDFLDIHVVIEGTERFGFSPAGSFGSDVSYDPARDICFFDAEPRHWITLSAGEFIIVFPGEGHIPGISDELLHKAVVKVRLRDG